MKKMILAGGSGFLGRALAKHFRVLGWEIIVLTRSPKERDSGVREVAWDARSVGEWAREIEGAEVLINLTGRSVDWRYAAETRWEIIASRVDSPRGVGEAIARAVNPPRVWLNASSASLYRLTFDTPMDENGAQGSTPE